MNKSSKKDSRQSMILYISRKSRSGIDAAKIVREELQSLQIHVEDMSHLSLQEFKAKLSQKNMRFRSVILGSGDGTLNALLDCFIEAQLTLGFIPLGTSNNFARNMDVPLDIKEACRVIADGRTKIIDLAVVNGIKFANVLGLGLSVRVNDELSGQAKRFWGRLAYMIYACRLASQSRPFHVRITAGEETVAIKTLQITVCHGRYYGPGITIAEGATMDDGLLNLIAPRIDAWWKGIALLPALLAGKIAEKKVDVYKISAPSIKIETRHPKRIDADGELVTHTPAVLGIHRQCLKVYVS